jgi:hypothetical protein
MACASDGERCAIGAESLSCLSVGSSARQIQHFGRTHIQIEETHAGLDNWVGWSPIPAMLPMLLRSNFLPYLNSQDSRVGTEGIAVRGC